MKINLNLGFGGTKSSPKTNLSDKSSGALHSSVVSSNSSKTNTSKKTSEFEEMVLRESKYYLKFLKESKFAKIFLFLYGIFSVFAIIYFVIFSDAPLWADIIAIFLIVILGIGGFFLESLLLKKEQFMVGVFIIDFYFYVAKNLMNSLKKPLKKMPYLLVEFKNLLRINAPFFKRMSKTEYEKMSPQKKSLYMKKYHQYIAKLYSKKN